MWLERLLDLPKWGVSSMSGREEAPGKTQDTSKRCLSKSLDTSHHPTRWARRGSLGISVRLLRQKMDGWNNKPGMASNYFSFCCQINYTKIAWENESNLHIIQHISNSGIIKLKNVILKVPSYYQHWYSHPEWWATHINKKISLATDRLVPTEYCGVHYKASSTQPGRHCVSLLDKT